MGLALAIVAVPATLMRPVQNENILLIVCLLGFCISFAFAWHRLTLARRMLIKRFSMGLAEGIDPELIKEIKALRMCCPDADIVLHYPINYLTNKTVPPHTVRVEFEGRTFHVVKLFSPK
jgi:hypothetical protein